MNKQINFSEIEFGTKRKKTHKEIFFERMEKIVPIKEWCAIIEPKKRQRQAAHRTRDHSKCTW